MRLTRRHGRDPHVRRAHFGIGVALGSLAAFAVGPGTPVAAPNQAPANTAEPTISGRAEQGRSLSASRGSWTGSGSIAFAYRWVRCGQDGGRPDGSDCIPIAGATATRYDLRGADVGFRLRVRVTATNSQGSQTAASNPTAVVVGPPVNTRLPNVQGNMLNGSTVTVDPGAWLGRQPISFSYQWLRCNTQGGDCVSIAGARGRNYRLTEPDVNHRIRFSITARNTIGSLTVLSGESGIVAEPLPAGAIRLASGEISIPATSVPRTERLIVSQVVFSPSPVTGRTRVITVRIRVKDTRSYVVRDALVFVRSTPRVTTGGDRQIATTDGWVTYQLVPNANFRDRTGYNVQFFVKAYRAGDPALAGVAGYRLVQVRTRSTQ
jgi:hypothetical protein